MTALGVFLGYRLKTQCSTRERVLAGWQWSHNCYSDIVGLYDARKPEFRRPGYKPFAAHGLAYRDNNLEYPALTGLFISAVNAGVEPGDGEGFLRANALWLGVAAAAGGAALAAATRRPKRILLYALSPAMISYALHNWDLLPVALTAAALWTFSRRWDAAAGVALGLGAAAKLYPGFLVPVLLLACLAEPDATRGRWRAAWLAAGSVAGFSVPNLIVLAYAGFDGWVFPWRMQSLRGPNPETHWFILRHQLDHTGLGSGTWLLGRGWARISQAASVLAFLGSSALLLRAEVRRERFRPVVACFGVAILFLLTAKVYSPQYALWLLPFFVVVRVPWHGFAAFAVADMFALGAVWSFYFHHSTFGGSPWIILQVAVVARYAALGYLLWLTRGRSEEILAESFHANRSTVVQTA
ncbi:MAG: glycosyltransferase 87 family protein [Actinomycetota bacterium]